MQTNITWDASGKWYWEPELGGRIALLRYGNQDIFRPQGFELVAEGAAIGRLDLAENVDLTGVDFRGGLYGAYARGNHVTKFGYYHMSAHLGDEFLLKNPTFPRLNWARDVLILGHSIYLSQDLRVYGEVGWAWRSPATAGLFRLGLQYYNGESSQFSFYDRFEQQLTFGVWYDY